MLSDSHAAALELYSRVLSDERFLTAFPPELDIVIWTARAARASQASEYARLIYDKAEQHQLYLALAELPVDFFDLSAASMERDQETVTCLRSVLMKPEHHEWVNNIWQVLDRVAGAVPGQRVV
jgi:hypothetical protein